MTSRRAFTLIEVLIAVFIIALGSIGIFALLAGVAQQQSRASDLGRGVAKAQGLIGSLHGRVGPIGEWVNTSGMPQIDPVFGASIARGVWYPAFAYFDSGSTVLPALSVNPRAPTNIGGGRFFVAPAREYVVYSNPPVYNGSMYEPFNGPASVGMSMWPGSGDFAGSPIAHLPFLRAALGTVRVEFWKTDTATGQESLAASMTDSELPAMITDPELAYQNDELTLPKDPMPSEPRVTFLYAEHVNSPPITSDQLAGLLSFNLMGNVDSTEWISSIRIRAAFRQDRLLSLGERVQTTPDPSRPTGRRAAAGATVLYRVTPSGRSQFITLGYTLNPLGRGGVFVPPERPLGRNEDATTGLLRVTDDYRLHYDDARSQYYLTWSTDEDALALDDVLIVGGQLNATPTSDRNRQGADNPVKVTRVTGPDGDRRAYLDDTPRTKARSLLEDIGSTSGAQIFRVYSMRRQVSSQVDDSQWEVRPVVAQVLDVQ